MKGLGLLLVALCVAPTMAFAQYDSEPVYPGYPGDGGGGQAPVCNALQGDWQIVEHVCNSGARPWDQFLVGRDRFEVIFRESTFTTIYSVGNCTRWSEGTYEATESLLTLHIGRATSNCGPADAGSFTYALGDITEDSFSIFVGPYGPGGICPPGDVLRNTYTRAY